MSIHPYQTGVTLILKSSPAVKKVAFSLAFLLYKQAASKYKKQQSLK